jgi:hypothetical protein
MVNQKEAIHKCNTSFIPIRSTESLKKKVSVQKYKNNTLFQFKVNDVDGDDSSSESSVFSDMPVKPKVEKKMYTIKE